MACYMRERDPVKKMDQMFGYLIGSRGIETKLKFKVAPIDGLTASDLSLGRIVSKIILGPSINSDMAGRAFKRMLEKNGHDGLATRVVASTIPYRPQVH